MRRKDVKKSSQTAPAHTARAESVEQEAADKETAECEQVSEERFVEDLLVRGEAAQPNQEGKLPPEATHVITKENEDGTVEVKRVRYKAF